MHLDRRLLGLVRNARLWLGSAVLCSLLGSGLVILQAALLASVVAQVFLDGAGLADVLPRMLALLGVIFGRAAATFLADGSATAGAGQIKLDLRRRLLEHIEALGPAYTRTAQTGDLVSSALQGVEALEAYCSQYLPQLVLAVILPLAVLALVFPLDLLTGIIFLVTAPLIPLFMILIGGAAERLTRRQFLALRRMSAFFLDTLQGLTMLKALNQSIPQAKRVEETSERYRRTTLEVLRLTFLSALALELLSTISTAIVAVEIGLRLLYGQLAFEQAFFILLIAPEFYLPLRMLGQRFHAAAAGVSAAHKIFEVLGTQPEGGAEAILPGPKVEIPAAPLVITAHGLSYRYPGRAEDALEDISFELHNSELVALVGPSGAGKSTLAHLLLRFMSSQAGELRLNGRPAQEFDVAAWRELFAWVPQAPALLRGTLADALRLARPAAPLFDVVAAARQAGLDEYIRGLPDGYETLLGEGGARLSGGQAQRLALGRAFLKNAPFLLLDEPSAALDSELERELEETLVRLCEQRGALVIAHRLPTILRATRILVLEGGRIVEQGTHAGLLEQNGVYARLYAQEGWSA